MLLQIRNMESDCCKMVVRNELTKLGFGYNRIGLGIVDIKEKLDDAQLKFIDETLRSAGLELIYERKNRLVELIKSAVYKLIYLSDENPKHNFSVYISQILRRDYTYLSNLFSSVQGVTIERYIISQKIKRIKDLLINKKMSLNNIAFILKYSSVAHLSNQFKKETGQTPSVFKQSSEYKDVTSLDPKS